MRPTLLITNDFPPRIGGIQSYVHELATRLPADRLVVLASDHPHAARFDATQPFPVVRYPASVLLPTPPVAETAAALIRQYGVSAVWYGAAAPLSLLTPRLRRHGIVRTVASSHGHEAGWALVPGARQLLRRIGTTNDVVTFVSRYARSRVAAAFGPDAALESLPPGVDSAQFQQNSSWRSTIRARYGLGERPVVVCVSRLVPRKGQDALIDAWPDVLERFPEARLLLVGAGPAEARLRTGTARRAIGHAVVFAGAVDAADLAGHYAAADVFAMPCRTRRAGMDVEGLGIVFLEASASGLPVIAGDSGGAPEAVRDGETGCVIDGRDRPSLITVLVRLLGDATLRARWGAAGRRWVEREWTWQRSAEKLMALLGS